MYLSRQFLHLAAILVLAATVGCIGDELDDEDNLETVEQEGISISVRSLMDAINSLARDYELSNNTNDNHSSYVQNLDTGDTWRYSRQLHRERKPPEYIGKSVPTGTFYGFRDRGYLCCFHRNLPAKLRAVIPRDADSPSKLGDLVVTNKFLTEPAPSQAPLNRAIEELAASAYARDPIVAYGLLHLKAVLIKDVEVGDYQASPTHYSKKDRILYVNAEDLRQFGYVVILHEVLHVSLHHAFRSGLITQTQYRRIALLNSSHFSNYDGYVGLAGNRDNIKDIVNLNLLDTRQLSMQKAFSVGYTYALLHRLAPVGFVNGSFTTVDEFAVKFLRDVAQNPRISTIKFVFANATLYKPLHLIDSSDSRNSKAIRFEKLFTDRTSDIYTIIEPFFSAARAHLNGRCGGKGCYFKIAGPDRASLFPGNGPL